ncbi:M16 family metallopeptidase [Filimonas effusa]|uniref:Insulinase family protein n=1 Tax=Filimonas effusa TaxID=2508721 RepID=A0A4Q1D833_9BACT|nr:insulinase family protein [Filimonas effusa]RXK85411.1 insulinase family protein [Filimonas effusa]
MIRKLLVLALLCHGQAYGRDLNDTIPLDKNIRTGKLSNGFTYYIRKNATPEKRVLFYLVNKVGSILETDEQQGLAHFLEHMAFNGTLHFPKNSLVNYLEKAGVRFGADLNAYTSFDETVFQLPVASDDTAVLHNAMQIMRDWAGSITLDDSEIDKERGVILSEKRQGISASQRLQTILLPISFNQSRYASRMPIGTENVLTSFRHSEIKQFYHNWYRPDLQALIVVGDINENEIEKKIKALFSDLKTPVNAPVRVQYTIPLTGKNQFRIVTDPELTGTAVQMTIKHTGYSLLTKADYRENVVRAIVSIMMNHRFNEIATQADAPFLQAGYSIGKMLSNLDALGATVHTKPGEFEKGVKAWWAILQQAAQSGFSDTELKRASVLYKAGIAQLYNEQDKLPSDNYVKEYVELFLHHTASPGIAYEYALTDTILGTLKTGEANQLYRKYFSAVNRDIIIQAEEKEKANLPTEQKMMEWLNTSGTSGYTEKNTTGLRLMDTQPFPGVIRSTAKDEENNITTLILENGIKVILKPTRFNNDQILFNASSPGGLSLVKDEDYFTGRIAGSLVANSGAGQLNRQSLQQLLNGRMVSVSPYITDQSEGLSGSASKEELETALQLVYLYFTSPRADTTVFKQFTEQQRFAYANAGKVAQEVFQDTVMAVMANHYFRKMKMPERELDKLNPLKALDIYKERFGNAGDFTFVFAGNFDAEGIKPLLLRYLASLPSSNKREQVQHPGVKPPSGIISRKVVRGKEAKASVFLSFPGEFEYSPSANIQLKALAGVLNMKLMERLREEEGGVYTVQANAATQELPSGEYNLSIRFICHPDNAEALIASTNKEIEKLKTQGIDKETVEKYLAGENKSLERAEKENGFWLSYLTVASQRNEKVGVKYLYERLKEVTPENIKRTANQFLNNSNHVRIVLLPETN